jgi:hypothetical protein
MCNLFFPRGIWSPLGHYAGLPLPPSPLPAAAVRRGEGGVERGLRRAASPPASNPSFSPPFSSLFRRVLKKSPLRESFLPPLPHRFTAEEGVK